MHTTLQKIEKSPAKFSFVPLSYVSHEKKCSQRQHHPSYVSENILCSDENQIIPYYWLQMMPVPIQFQN